MLCRDTKIGLVDAEISLHNSPIDWVERAKCAHVRAGRIMVCSNLSLKLCFPRSLHTEGPCVRCLEPGSVPTIWKKLSAGSSPISERSRLTNVIATTSYH